MRKLLFLSAVVLVAASATGCNCCRNACGGGGGLFGSLGHRQPAYAAAPCCQAPVQAQCCDPCGGGYSQTVASPVMEAPCCN